MISKLISITHRGGARGCRILQVVAVGDCAREAKRADADGAWG